MKRTLQITDDGSHTLYVPELDEHFHSTHGAIQESKHVFINAGFNCINKTTINVFEVGFGTGLNAWLTLNEALLKNKQVNYFGIEKYPLKANEYQQLNYATLFNKSKNEQFLKLHECQWNETVELSNNYQLTKLQSDILLFNIDTLPLIDLVYFDAFAPNKQPEMWDFRLFEKLYKHCKPRAVLVTYCAKGEVRRNIQKAGFIVERLAGPPGKREMLRGIKPLIDKKL